MNEWYQLVYNYKSEHNLTWPQLASQLGVNERGLRDKEHQPSAKILAKLRELLRGQSIPTELGMQPTIFTSEHLEKAVDQALSSKKVSAQEVKTEMTTNSTKSTQTDRDNNSQPALSEEEADRLLKQHEYIRDPIHQDIWITALERELIDTPAFQRLRYLKQLGPTDLVYPGAVHTRFLHSIGTVHCAQQIVETVNHNFDIYDKPWLIRVGKYQNLLVRVCALLHDLSHIPYGHTLEDEGNLRSPEWEDIKRFEFWLGDKDTSDKSITNKIKDFFKRMDIPENKATHFIQDIRRYLFSGDKTKGSEYPMNLEYPFVADIVGNTLCADLLDYLDRDMYYCGLRERSGDRVVKYLAIVRVQSLSDPDKHIVKFKESRDPLADKGRVVLLAYRVEREHAPTGRSKIVPKPEINSEAIDLLRRRYALAEKVYFHRTKVAASAMLISAASSASLNWDEIFSISDEAFLTRLEASTNERTKYLIAKYKARQLYKAAYEIKYRPRTDKDKDSLSLYDDLYPDYRNPKWRLNAESEIEECADIPKGSVAIYCPELGMNLKQFEMLVQNQPEGEIKPLKDILDDTRQKEMNAINERFEQLWKVQILIDPEIMNVSDPSNRLNDFNKICEEIMTFPNERTDLVLGGKGRPIDDQIVYKVIEEYQKKSGGRVPVDVFNELVEASRRAERTGKKEQVRKHLDGLMKSPG